ncbi:General secretion pathway protein H [Klebsiella michiganensis]|uniref:Type II secretion system protein H n=1 Tax=Klebsiella michiganensis TaxID=1134687 RepID=A0A7H4LXX7_9ENTR|nr:General secretion pathway protein H [Klebsiella michiganensis]
MRQRGFTVLEMMLVVLLMGSAASLVIMSFPAMQQDTAEQQLQRFQAQLEFAMDSGMQNDRLLGIQIRPNGWQFQVLQKPGGGNAFFGCAFGSLAGLRLANMATASGCVRRPRSG